MRRSGKFYFQNEKEVMESLGLKQVPGSGSGWNTSKEDGENDYILCQLKSTDAQSISVKQKDVHRLVENALMSNRIPVFAIQFLNTGEVWLMVRPDNAKDFSDYLKTGKYEKQNSIVEQKDVKQKKVKKVVSTSDAREEWNKEQSQKYNKVKSAF